jgi:hypothetical protein
MDSDQPNVMLRRFTLKMRTINFKRPTPRNDTPSFVGQAKTLDRLIVPMNEKRPQ